MTTRQIRRAAERKQRKLARKQQTQEPTATPTQNLNAVPSRPDAVTRADINRVNSQHSTGPRTPEGKVRSSRNSFKHGLYSQQLVMPGENPAELDALRADLRAEHRPANTTEEILVNEMAEHYWRLRRMRRYEVHAMSDEVNLDKWFNLLPLILRLMTSAERGFHKSLAELRRLQKGRDEAAHLSEPKTQANNVVPQNRTASNPGFVPQNPPTAAEVAAAPSDPGFVPQNATPSDHGFIPQVFHVEDLDNYVDHPQFEEIYSQYVSHLARQMADAA